MWIWIAILLFVAIVIIIWRSRRIGGGVEKTPDMQEFYIIRHGETDTNLAGLANTKDDDIPLNSTGRDQAARTGKYLRSRNIKPIIISSPSVRAVETAEIIAHELGAKVIQDDRLSEQDKGDFSGVDMSKRPDLKDRLDKLNKSYEQRFPDPIERVKNFDKYLDALTVEFHGEDIVAKIADLNAVMNEHKDAQVILVTHSGNIGSWLPYIARIDPRHMLNGDLSKGKNCSIAYLLMKHGQVELLIPSNTTHLGLV